MKFPRKFLAIVIALFTTGIFMPMDVTAEEWADAPILSIDASYNSEDNTVVCNVAISDYEKLGGMDFRIAYDQNQLNGPGSDTARIIKSGMYQSAIVLDNGGDIGTDWLSEDLYKGDSGSGSVILTVIFTVNNNYSGETEITLNSVYTLNAETMDSDENNAGGRMSAVVQIPPRDNSAAQSSAQPTATIETKAAEPTAEISSSSQSAAQPKAEDAQQIEKMYVSQPVDKNLKSGDTVTINKESYTVVGKLNDSQPIVTDKDGKMYVLTQDPDQPTWSILDIISLVGTVIINAFIIKIHAHSGQKPPIKRNLLIAVSVLMLSEAVIWICTQHLTGKPAIYDRWSVIILVPLALSVVLLIIGNPNKSESQ